MLHFLIVVFVPNFSESQHENIIKTFQVLVPDFSTEGKAFLLFSCFLVHIAEIVEIEETAQLERS